MRNHSMMELLVGLIVVIILLAILFKVLGIDL